MKNIILQFPLDIRIERKIFSLQQSTRPIPSEGKVAAISWKGPADVKTARKTSLQKPTACPRLPKQQGQPAQPFLVAG